MKQSHYNVEVEEDAANDILVTFITSLTGTGVGFVEAADFTAPTDYTTTITSGTKTANFEIAIVDDSDLEPNETFIVEIMAVNTAGAISVATF